MAVLNFGDHAEVVRMEEPFSKVPMGIYFKYENAVYRKCTKDCAEDIHTHRLRWFNPRETIHYAKQARRVGGTKQWPI